MVQHELFTATDEESLQYEWICDSEKEDPEVVRQKVYSIFMERSSILFNNDPTTLWLKETVGYLLNQIEAAEDDIV